MNTNQNPEQRARDHIDQLLTAAGWIVQHKKHVNLSASLGVAVREYQTDIGPADYVLFVDRKPVGIIEAKREEEAHHLTQVEEQSYTYARSKLKYLNNGLLPFVYESTGVLTRFTNYRDPKPRSRTVFHFHRPETLHDGFNVATTLRTRLQTLPELPEIGLRPAQINAIRNLETAFKDNRPRSLIQMATGAGKTFTACTFVYRLLKHAKAKRILFLVDTRNLGEQAEQEFLKYQPTDDNRKFTELYNVQRLTSGYIANDSHVCISTIQRLYSILKGEELDATLEEENPNESRLDWQKKAPIPVEYSPKNPIEQFDFIIIDECHRSIYNLWRQVLDYYDAFLIGLTATPDKRTFGFFNENVVSEYTYEQSVADGVNVPYDVFTIETDITKNGAAIAKQSIEKREKLSRRRRWEQLDDDLKYTANQLDKDVVNPSQILNIIKAFKTCLPQIFPERKDEKGEYEVPKTLIFAKTDSHADDIIEVVRREFGEGNDFCKKITYNTIKQGEDPKSVLNRFRNSWNPRIAVTVDMIATGTDVKPLEILLFMRDVRSVNYFEQMKGRGTRTINFDDLQKVSRTATHTKTHFVIIDAVGATKSKKTDSRPLERKPSVALKDLLGAVAMGAQDEDLFLSLANRLIRLNKQLSPDESQALSEQTGGKTLLQLVQGLLNAYDPDMIEAHAQPLLDAVAPTDRSPEFVQECQQQACAALAKQAATPFTGKVNDYLDNVRRLHEQVIDHVNQDKVLRAEWDKDATENAKHVVGDFAAYIAAHKDEITALSLFYDQPYRRKDITFNMIKDLLATLQREKPLLSPHYVWEAYTQLETVTGDKPKDALVALVSLVRRVVGIDPTLIAYNKQVDRNFQRWILQQNAGQHNKFTPEQIEWLRLLKEHIANSFHIEVDDLDYTPFDAQGGRGRMWQLFGSEMLPIIEELNEVLAA
ncbi:MAG: restriction endonuclease subunit R [Thiothrix lacustris]|uniref:Restriction endonuclease subunit R n=1 Tax=Thiothrix lacustris TaxID=525917 RepID=A0A1Y1QCR2_9GAMM|nr:MAG: restriction endonuclease subunit R [Thiothrix lacustris]